MLSIYQFHLTTLYYISFNHLQKSIYFDVMNFHLQYIITQRNEPHLKFVLKLNEILKKVLCDTQILWSESEIHAG